MIPYGSLYFFYIIGILIIPAIILRLLEVNIKYYLLVLCVGVSYLLFHNSKIEVLCFVMFYFCELILVEGFIYINSKHKSRWLMRGAVFLSALPLILVKTSSFYTTRTIGFLGISYLTFRAIEMIIESYDGLISKINIVDFTNFVLFFPTISSGPIDRFRRFSKDVLQVIPRREYIESLGEGLWKIVQGVGYKFIVADIIADHWLNKIPFDHTFVHTIKYMYAYSFYLFFDFAGYSLMAIGTAYLLGIKVPPNFNLPFISKDMKEFWNRWHMSLSFWFRDFIYTRFVMSSLKKKRFKSRYTASYVGFMITMVTMGFWHGLTVYYIIYGFYQGMLIVATDFFQRKNKLYKKYKNTAWWKAMSIAVTFNLVCLGFLIFSGYNFIHK